MKKILLFIVLPLLLPHCIQAQVTLSNGRHVMEISGGVAAYYNQRLLKPDENNRNKDRFRLRDAQLQIEGRIDKLYEYELQVDFVDLASMASGEIDPENPGLMDAYIKYKGLRFMDVQFGYGKLFYGRSSLVPFTQTVYWQRAQIVRGNLFSRRDVGITLMKDFWRQRVNVYGGVYTGLGEITLRGDNDASGGLEYVGRVDVAYPSRYRYRDIDTRITPIPMFALGVNARYTEKNLPEGRAFPAFATGEYGLKVINGERLAYGMDVAFQYLGFSGLFEIHQLRITPQNENDPLFQGLPVSETNGFILAGGYVSQLNYFKKSWGTIFSLRYEELDLNDLIPGNSQRISAALAYQIKGFDSMIKFQYFKILSEEVIDPIRWTEQFRIGWQLNFN
ncbi:MAG: OprO/OprP family phosphate-selective porin [Schleiferiaceae bacterium]|nr:OprO/OprP family phosphate-selective porin [Schleiferiaceae bacterium]